MDDHCGNPEPLLLLCELQNSHNVNLHAEDISDDFFGENDDDYEFADLDVIDDGPSSTKPDPLKPWKTCITSTPPKPASWVPTAVAAPATGWR